MKPGDAAKTGLVVEGLVKKFGDIIAVEDVSFTVASGEFISLLGPSGCGKTTTLRCIAGFERPDGGRITVDGETFADPATGRFLPPNRRRFGMVFQSYAIWPHMTVLANVAYPLTIQKKYSRSEIRARATEQLRLVGLAGYEARYPGQLSGGQQQRVALARALVMEPRVLLFDEPLSNLDAKLRERMRFELIEIQSKLGIPAVYVTHDQAEAMVMSSRVIVMEKGRIAQSGSPEDIYAHPSSRFVADFIGLSNFLPAEVEGGLETGGWIVRSALGRHGCTGAGSQAPGDRVLLAIRPEQIELSSEPLDGWNAFAADVQSRFFLGPHCEYFLRIGDLVLRAQTPAGLNLRPGERVHARVRPEHCQVVVGESEPAESSAVPGDRERAPGRTFAGSTEMVAPT